MTLKSARLLALLFTAASLPAFAQNLAVVNGKPIPSSRVEIMVKQLATQGQKDSPELRKNVKEELINREILIQEANKLGLGTTADVKEQVEMARQAIMIRALVNDFVKKNPVSEAEITAEYNKVKAQAGDKEYHARHILVEKEDEAKAIIVKLKGGAKFEELAKASKDTGSAANGGDLDWVSPASLEVPFGKAMVALKKGETSETPVQTQYGYHVIRLDDVRAAKLPTLEEVKPRIAQTLQQQKLLAFQEKLRKQATIK